MLLYVKYYFFIVSVLYQEEKAKAGKKPSMWKVYLKVYGRRNFWAALMKLVGDCMGYIGPLAVGGITLYVQNIKLDIPKVREQKWS